MSLEIPYKLKSSWQAAFLDMAFESKMMQEQK